MGSKIGELIIAPIYANLPSDMQASGRWGGPAARACGAARRARLQRSGSPPPPSQLRRQPLT